ncbi:MAG: FtsX-like permease family protein [Nocardiopsaceae bacterium]|jgi:predicted lysophospholipase L1 biosynthesis ABC-type transport system permease subunit|nr:FtsX-like permease family protein [Nocardiopsaceae bacterium]
MTAPNSLLWPRMGSVRILLITVLVSVVIVATTVAALAGFAADTLPRAVSSELTRSHSTTISIYGAFSAQQARIDRPRVSSALRRAFGAIPFAADEATWSDPFNLPGKTTGKTVSLLQAAEMARVRSQVRLTSGSWPSPSAPGQPIEAVAPASVASNLHMKTGRPVVLRDRQSGARVRFVLTGQYRPVDPSSRYWTLSLLGSAGRSVQNRFITYGPLLVGTGAFEGPVSDRSGLATGGANWLVVPAIKNIGLSQLRPLAQRVRSELSGLAKAPDLGGLQITSGLPEAFSGVATRLVVARSLLLVGEIELLLLAAAALTLIARTLVSQREDESALLAARGAGRRQMLGLALGESLLIAVIGTVAGLLIGTRIASALVGSAQAGSARLGSARLGPALPGSGQLHVAGLRVTGAPADVWWTMAAVVLICVAVILWPVLRPPSPTAVRAGKGRRATVSAAAKVGGDIALLLLAGLAVWQLRQYSVLGRASGAVEVDPVLAFAPAIALAAVTVLPLRILPALAAAADRLAARTRRFGLAMTSWQFSRRATRQSAPMLLVVLAVGTGTLALAQHQSWRQSVFDQAAFATGADVRANLIEPLPLGRAGAVTDAPGVRAAMAVSTSVQTAGGSQVLALTADKAARTVLIRRNESATPPAALWRRLAPAGQSAAVMLPGRPARLRITARLTGGSGTRMSPFGVTVSVADGSGAVFSLRAGKLPADGQAHALTVNLSGTRQAIYPLRLLSISASYALPSTPSRGRFHAAATRTAALTVGGLATSSSAAGPFGPAFASSRALTAWRPAILAPDLAVTGVGLAPRLIKSGSGPGRIEFHPGYGETSQYTNLTAAPVYAVFGQLTLTAPVPRTIPAIATRDFLTANSVHVGDLYQLIGPGSAPITTKIVASVSDFPTITGRDGGLIVDLAAVQTAIVSQSGSPLPVNQWWLTTTRGAVPPALLRALSALSAGAAVTNRSAAASKLLSDPMSVIPEQAVQWIAVAAALLAVLGFSVSVAGSVHERRSQAALLSALGVTESAQVRLLCLEALALSVPAAVTGLLLGILLARVLVPAVILTPAATTPIPPVVVTVPLTAAVLLCLAVAAIPVAAAAATALRRADAAGQLRAGETG